MVVLAQPQELPSGKQLVWKTIQEAAPLKVQRYIPDPAAAAMTRITATLTGDKNEPVPFRVVTASAPFMELATAGTAEEAAGDLELLLSYIVGVMPEDPGAIHEAVRRVLDEVVAKAACAAPCTTVKTEPDLRFSQHLEPWALTLLQNSDKLRYVCYALKIATSLGADVATAGFGGEEVVTLCFTSVDAALLSSWLAWFTSQLLDSSPASNVVQRTLSFDFEGGPRAVMAQADSICALMRQEDVEQVTRLALHLKRRIAVLVGDIFSLLIPNDMSVGGAVVTEMLTRLKPVGAMDALRQLLGWYEMMNPEHRAMLEDKDQLTGVMQSANSSVRKLVLSHYDQSLKSKGISAARRGVVALFIPGGVWVNLAASLALSANLGRSSCVEVFDTLDAKMSNASATMHRVLAVAIGTLVVLAHCADRAEPAAAGGRGFSALDALALAAAVIPGAQEVAKRRVQTSAS